MANKAQGLGTGGAGVIISYDTGCCLSTIPHSCQSTPLFSLILSLSLGSHSIMANSMLVVGWERRDGAAWESTITSSLNSLLVSFLMRSRYCTWPAENPTSREMVSVAAVNWLKSWQVG